MSDVCSSALFSDFPSSSGSLTSISPAGSPSGCPLQAGTFADIFDAPSSPRYSFSETFATKVGGAVVFEAPELPEETLMEVRASVTNVVVFLLTLLICVNSRSTRTLCAPCASPWASPAVWWRWLEPAAPERGRRMPVSPPRCSSRTWWQIRSAR